MRRGPEQLVDRQLQQTMSDHLALNQALHKYMQVTM
jgi:hypothetical protein